MRSRPLVLYACLAVVSCTESRSRIVADPVCPVPAPSASNAAKERPRLVVHQRVGTPVSIEACAAQGECREWVRYPSKPPRAIVDAQLSPTGRHFFVWSKPDGRARSLDVYETPASGFARLSRHAVPGFGGHLGWVAGDRLFHWWGCGTDCANGQLRDATGDVILTFGGALIEQDAEGTRGAVADFGGEVTWIDFAEGVGYRSSKVPSLLFPVAFAWEREALKVTYGSGSGGDVVLRCAKSTPPRLVCVT